MSEYNFPSYDFKLIGGLLEVITKISTNKDCIEDLDLIVLRKFCKFNLKVLAHYNDIYSLKIEFVLAPSTQTAGELRYSYELRSVDKNTAAEDNKLIHQKAIEMIRDIGQAINSIT